MITKINDEQIEILKSNMKQYDPNEFQLFVDEIGWQDWMYEYTEADEWEELSESEVNEINAYLKKLWDEVHPERD